MMNADESGIEMETRRMSKSVREIFAVSNSEVTAADATCSTKAEKQWDDVLLKSNEKYSSTAIYKFFNKICTNQVFIVVIYICIGINSITLSIDNYPATESKAKKLEEINHIVTWIFIAELIIKVFGLGVRTYCIDPINQFDALIVTFSIVEMILEKDIEVGKSNNKDEQENRKMLTLFRGFRLFRVFRLARKWKSFHMMMVKIMKSL